MRMLGFTAEVSLSKMRGHYAMVWAHPQAGGALYPAYIERVA